MFPRSSRERVAIRLCLGLTFIALGCASRGDVDLLEARLRNQELQLRKAEQRATQLASQLEEAQQQQDLLRSQIAGQLPALPAETTQALAAATGLKFHTLLTAGQDRDGVAGDDQLHVFLFPHDADGELVKLTGNLEVEVFDPSQPGGMQRIGHKQYTAEEARKLWHNGFLSSGFQTELPLEAPPSGTKLVLHGRLTTIDGRQFDASHTVSVVSRSGNYSLDGMIPPQPLADRKPLDEPSGIVPARFAEEGRSSLNINDPTERLVPDPYADRPASAPLPFPSERPAAPPVDRPVSRSQSPPFPQATPISDRWTDETIPAWR